ncbi:hypothetical protein PMAYCL1PPCAC_20859, partial [Pristionchus mayeri]
SSPLQQNVLFRAEHLAKDVELHLANDQINVLVFLSPPYGKIAIRRIFLPQYAHHTPQMITEIPQLPLRPFQSEIRVHTGIGIGTFRYIVPNSIKAKIEIKVSKISPFLINNFGQFSHLVRCVLFPLLGSRMF